MLLALCISLFVCLSVVVSARRLNGPVQVVSAPAVVDCACVSSSVRPLESIFVVDPPDKIQTPGHHSGHLFGVQIKDRISEVLFLLNEESSRNHHVGGGRMLPIRWASNDPSQSEKSLNDGGWRLPMILNPEANGVMIATPHRIGVEAAFVGDVQVGALDVFDRRKLVPVDASGNGGDDQQAERELSHRISRERMYVAVKILLCWWAVKVGITGGSAWRRASGWIAFFAALSTPAWP